MKFILFGLTLASVASAQIQVNGISMVPASMASAMSAAPMASEAAMSSAAPSVMTSSMMAASSSAAPYQASSAPPAMYTAPPAYSPPPPMPYESFMGGGYKSMDCGYGYQKGSDGSCQQMSWVCKIIIWRFLSLIGRSIIDVNPGLLPK